MRYIFIVLASVVFLSACAPEVGSERWCKGLGEKPKSEWTFSEAGDYAKHCVLR